MPQMPWICGDTTMLEQIERKRTLCMEIRSRQHPHLQKFSERASPTDRNEDRNQEQSQCKQESSPILPGWGKSGGGKKIRPPPYPTQKTVFWDTAIWHDKIIEPLCHTSPHPLLPRFSSRCTDSLQKEELQGKENQKDDPHWCQRTKVDTTAIFLLIQVVTFSYHHWWYLIFFYFLWLGSCIINSRVDIWRWIDIF